jgi:hypothetical protein
MDLFEESARPPESRCRNRRDCQERADLRRVVWPLVKKHAELLFQPGGGRADPAQVAANMSRCGAS